MALEELYWVHVEHFPMHRGGLPSSVLGELISVFSHASADHMTSRFSTFPYSAPECDKFLQLLKISRTYPNDGHITSLVARLWSLVCRPGPFMLDVIVLISGFILVNHRVSTHYGERHARLSRNQAILVDDAQESRRVAFLTSLLSFQASAGYHARLNDIFIDHLVYAHQWKPFMSACLRDWKATSNLVSLVYMRSCFMSDRILQDISTLMYVTTVSTWSRDNYTTLGYICYWCSSPRLHSLLQFRVRVLVQA